MNCLQVAGDRHVPVLHPRRRDAEDNHRHCGRQEGTDHGKRADPVDPHHRRRRVTEHGAGTAGIRGGDDGGKIADMDLAPENAGRHRGADQCRGDVIEKAREQEDDDKKHERPHPACWQQLRQDFRHAAVLEMAGQKRKADQQAEQIDQQHPLMRHVQAESSQAFSGLEAGEQDLVGGNCHHASEGHWQGMMVKQGDAEKCRGEENEIDGNAGDGRLLSTRCRERQRYGEQGRQGCQEM